MTCRSLICATIIRALPHQRLDPVPAARLAHEARGEPRHGGRQRLHHRPGRVDDDEPAAREARRLVVVARRRAHEQLDDRDAPHARGDDVREHRVDGRARLDRVPAQQHASGEAAMRVAQAAREARMLVARLEGRVDEHEPPALGRRQVRLERDPAIRLAQLDPAVARGRAAQLAQRVGMHLAEEHPVLRARHATHDPRAAGIAQHRAARLVEPAHHAEIGTQGRWRQRVVDDAQDAVARLSGSHGLLAGEVVARAAGMAVEAEEGRGLRGEAVEREGEHRVLQHVGEVPGVEAMAVVHRARLIPWRGARDQASERGC
jgi:hypothetical protein